MLALLKYMDRPAIDAMKDDLVKLRKVPDRLMVDRFLKYMDIERLRLAPMIPEDIMVYNYLQYEFKGKFIKSKLISRYDREVMRGQIEAIQEMRSMFTQLGIDL